MRKLLLFSFTAFLLFTCLTAESQTRKEKREARKEARREAKREKKEKREKGEEGEEKDEYDNPEIRDKQAAEQIKDPALGYVPYNRLLPAIEYTQNLKNTLKNNRGSSFNNLQSTPLTWIERGPVYDSVGPSNGNTRGGANTLGGHTSGRLRAFLMDTLNDPTGNTVYTGGVAGGLWKTTNFLSVINNWTPVDDRFDNLSISSICQDPTNPQIIYFSTGEPTDNADRVIGAGVWKSTNGGASFTWLPATADFIRCFKIACDAAGNVYLACRTTTVPVNQQSGLLRSTNGGNTWVDITAGDLDVPNTGTSCTDFEITTSGILNAMFGYRGVGNKVQHRYTLTPAAVTPGTWSTSTGFRTSNAAAIRTEMAVLGDILYAVTINTAYNTDSCYKSVNGGLTWTKQNTTVMPTGLGNGQGWYSISLAINPLNSAQLISGGLDAFRSTNSGSTWTKFTNWTTPQPYVHADHHYAQYWIVGGVARMILGTDGGIFYSPDNGATFSSKNRNLGIKQFYSAAIHPTAGSPYLLAGAQDNGVHQLKNAGLSYSIEVTGGDGLLVHINQQNSLIQFGSYVYNQYRRSTNGGNTWANLNLSTTQGLFVNPFDYDDGQNILYASNGPLGNMRRLLNANTAAAGTNVVVGLGAISATTSLTALKVSPYTANRLYFGTSAGKVYRLDDANTVVTATSVANTTDISGASFPAGTVICVNTGTDDNNLVATYSNYGVNNVWVTNNGGTSWSAVDGNLPDMPVRWAMFQPGDNRKLFLATEAGIYTTTNISGAATQWLPETTYPTVSTYMLKMRTSDSTIVAGTHGRGLWTAKIPCIPPTINQPVNQAVCNALPTNAVTFTGSDDPVAVYTWTNSDPSIGLAASGTGNIASFNAINTGTVPVVATITVTASVGTCTGSTSFTITVSPTPAAAISYSGSPYCSTALTATVTRTGTAGGTYTAAPAGLTINAATGTVTPNTSTPGTYTVTYTIAAAGGCTLVTATTTLTITQAPNANISYPGTPYCSNAGTAAVTQIGTTGGTYSATPAGLSINAATGAVTLGTSTAGTYTVTYSMPASGGCGITITTTTITVTAAPAATISYAGSPYCSNAGTVAITLTGTTGGTYSAAPAGLTINATTGAVTTGTSTAGTYTVTYSIPASAGCAAFVTTTTITITTLPAATISYTGSPYCSNAGTANVTRTGTSGGTYTATPAGLTINAATGAITLGTSTAGTYTVTYSIAAGSGCPVVTATTTITITALPAATISYAGNPYCQDAGTATVTRTGTAGGTYSSTAGLTIDATTGAVTLGTSTAGTYTVTYTLAAGGGCAAVTTTTTITVNAISVAPTGATASSTTICGSGTVTLTVTGGSLGAGATWRWYTGSCGGTAVATGATVNINVGTTTTYFVRAEGTCNTTACASVTVTVNVQPAITLSATAPTSLFPHQTSTLTATVTPATGNTITWYRNGNVVAGATGLSLVAGVDALGLYTVRATTALGCTALSNAVLIKDSANNRLFITPNPNNGQFRVRYFSSAQQFGFVRHLVMFAENGQKVFDKTFPITAPYSSMNIDARHLGKGFYVVMLTDAFGEEVLATGKVILQ